MLVQSLRHAINHRQPRMLLRHRSSLIRASSNTITLSTWRLSLLATNSPLCQQQRVVTFHSHISSPSEPCGSYTSQRSLSTKSNDQIVGPHTRLGRGGKILASARDTKSLVDITLKFLHEDEVEDFLYLIQHLPEEDIDSQLHPLHQQQQRQHQQQLEKEEESGKVSWYRKWLEGILSVQRKRIFPLAIPADSKLSVDHAKAELASALIASQLYLARNVAVADDLNVQRLFSETSDFNSSSSSINSSSSSNSSLLPFEDIIKASSRTSSPSLERILQDSSIAEQQQYTQALLAANKLGELFTVRTINEITHVISLLYGSNDDSFINHSNSSSNNSNFRTSSSIVGEPDQQRYKSEISANKSEFFDLLCDTIPPYSAHELLPLFDYFKMELTLEQQVRLTQSRDLRQYVENVLLEELTHVLHMALAKRFEHKQQHLDPRTIAAAARKAAKETDTAATAVDVDSNSAMKRPGRRYRFNKVSWFAVGIKFYGQKLRNVLLPLLQEEQVQLSRYSSVDEYYNRILHRAPRSSNHEFLPGGGNVNDDFFSCRPNDGGYDDDVQFIADDISNSNHSNSSSDVGNSNSSSSGDSNSSSSGDSNSSSGDSNSSSNNDWRLRDESSEWKILIDNLPIGITEETLRHALRKCGNISKIWLHLHEEPTPSSSLQKKQQQQQQKQQKQNIVVAKGAAKASGNGKSVSTNQVTATASAVEDNSTANNSTATAAEDDNEDVDSDEDAVVAGSVPAAAVYSPAAAAGDITVAQYERMMEDWEDSRSKYVRFDAEATDDLLDDPLVDSEEEAAIVTSEEEDDIDDDEVGEGEEQVEQQPDDGSSSRKGDNSTVTKKIKKQRYSVRKPAHLLKSNNRDNFAFVKVSDQKTFENFNKDAIRLFGINIQGQSCKVKPAKVLKGFHIEVGQNLTVQDSVVFLNHALSGQYSSYLPHVVPGHIRPLFLHAQFDSHEDCWLAFEALQQFLQSPRGAMPYSLRTKSLGPVWSLCWVKTKRYKALFQHASDAFDLHEEERITAEESSNRRQLLLAETKAAATTAATTTTVTTTSTEAIATNSSTYVAGTTCISTKA